MYKLRWIWIWQDTRWMSEMLFNLTKPLDIHRMDNRLCLWSQIVGSQLSPSLPAFFQFRSTFKRLGCSVWKGIWSCTKAMYVRPCFVPLAVTGSPGYRYRHTRAGYGNWTAIIVHTLKTLQSKGNILQVLRGSIAKLAYCNNGRSLVRVHKVIKQDLFLRAYTYV